MKIIKKYINNITYIYIDNKLSSRIEDRGILISDYYSEDGFNCAGYRNFIIGREKVKKVEQKMWNLIHTNNEEITKKEFNEIKNLAKKYNFYFSRFLKKIENDIKGIPYTYTIYADTHRVSTYHRKIENEIKYNSEDISGLSFEELLNFFIEKKEFNFLKDIKIIRENDGRIWGFSQYPNEKDLLKINKNE